jgi:glycosyltransferase involved in cell wall biosynthesis
MNKLYVVMPVINCLELTKAAIESIGSICTVILIDNGSTDGTPRWGEQMNNAEFMGGKTLKYIRNNEKKGVAASWNQGIKMAFEDPQCEYVAVLNNDIVLHPKTLEHLMRFMDKTGYLMVTGDNIKDRMSAMTLIDLELPEPFTDFDTWKIEGWRAEGPDFSCFMISRETIRVIGWFDENFLGAYCEDQDYHARLDRARRHIGEHNDQNIPVERIHFKRLSTAPYYHYASQTLARNAEIRQEVSAMHGRNQGHYIRKWGGEHPFVMDGGGFMQPFGDATKNWRDW